MPPVGDYLLTNVGFRQETPTFSLRGDADIVDASPTVGTTLSLMFDTATRYCVGWRNITTGERFSCPTSQSIDQRYEQCSACQKRTGFNPAFYHAASVSPQQDARNAEPHILYLAYFGGTTVKVGISHAARGHARLLEQGARHAVILDTFPTAHIARQYEVSIARLPGVAETVSAKQKITLLSAPLDPQHLTATIAQAEAQAGVSFNAGELLSFDSVFFPQGTPILTGVVDTTDQAGISGSTVGMLGSLLICEQQHTPLVLPLKRFVGYRVTLSDTETPFELPAQQMTLF